MDNAATNFAAAVNTVVTHLCLAGDTYLVSLDAVKAAGFPRSDLVWFVKQLRQAGRAKRCTVLYSTSGIWLAPQG